MKQEKNFFFLKKRRNQLVTELGKVVDVRIIVKSH